MRDKLICRVKDVIILIDTSGAMRNELSSYCALSYEQCSLVNRRQGAIKPRSSVCRLRSLILMTGQPCQLAVRMRRFCPEDTTVV